MTVLRYVLLGLIVILSLGLGVAGGYFWGYSDATSEALSW